MTIKISRVRKVPKFPRQEGEGLFSIFQLLLGIIIWIGLLIIFAITAWALWFNTSLAYLFGQPSNTFPWWLGVLCTIFIFPFTVLIILISSIAQILSKK